MFSEIYVNWNQIFNVGSDEEITILDAATIIAELMNLPTSRLVAQPSLSGSVQRRYPSIAKLRSATAYTPQVNFRTGMKKVIDWYTDDQIKLESDFR